MKKLLCAILALATALSLCAGSLAGDDTVTLSQLKASAPESVRFTIDGVVYDAPVILPEGDALPLLLCALQGFDAGRLAEFHPDARQDDTHFDGSLWLTYHVGETSLTEGRIGYSARYCLPDGAALPENDVTVERLTAMIYRDNERLGGDPDVDLRPLVCVARSGLCHAKRVGGDFEADRERPFTGMEKGVWEVAYAQYLHGARVFCERRPADMPAAIDGPAQTSYIRAVYLDEENHSFAIKYLKEQRILERDARVLSWDGLMNVLRQRIEAGTLKSVYRVELGYAVAAVAEGAGDGPSVPRFVLFPCWEIKGLDTENNEWQAAVNLDWGNPPPTSEDALDEGLRNVYDFVYQLRLHGQTGGVIGHRDLVYHLQAEPK